MTLQGLGDGLRGRAREAAVLWRGLTGEDAYDKYRAHFEASHSSGDADRHDQSSSKGGGERLMTEREFWRDQSDRQDHNPQGRCC